MSQDAEFFGSHGKAHRPTIKVSLTDTYVQKVRPDPAGRTIHYDTKLHGFALVCETSAHKSYKAKYTHMGRSRTYSLGEISAFKHVEEARDWARDLLYEARKGRDPQAERVLKRSDGTFASHVREFLEDRKDKKSVSQTAAYLTPLADAKVWGKVPTVDIPRTEIRALFKRTSKRSASVGNQELAALGAFFTWVIREKELTMAHPCKEIERHKFEGRERFMDDDEVREFWTALADVGPLEAKVLRALLLTGQRSAEVIGMRRQDIETGTIKLSEKFRARLEAIGQPAPKEVSGFWWTLPGKKTGGWCGTKNHCTHTVFLPPTMADLIGPGKEGFVFADVYGKPTTSQKLAKAMQKICKITGMPRTTPHDLRRSFSSALGGLDFSDEAIGRVLNHRKGGVTATYNRHKYFPQFWEIASAAYKHLTSLEKMPVAGHVPLVLAGKKF